MLEKIKKGYNNFQSNRELIFGYSSFLGFVTTLLYTIYAINQSQWDISFIASLLVLLLVNASLVVAALTATNRYKNLFKEYSDYDNHIEKLQIENTKLNNKSIEIVNDYAKVFSIFHNICHEYRIIINKIHTDLMADKCDNFSKRAGSFWKYMLFWVYNIKEAFDLLTGDSCCVTIKLIVPSDKDQVLVKTFVRDSISYRKRGEIDRKYPIYHYHENTAFKQILDRDIPENYYINNDLKSDKKYNNLNPKWRELYNACLVVPIRLSAKDNQASVIGFICIDNFEGNFDDKICLDFISALADNSFHLFRAYNDLSSKFQKHN